MPVNVNKILGKLKGLPLHFQILIAALPSVILIVFVIFVIVEPKKNEINKLRIKVADLDQKIAESESKIKRLDALIKEHEMLKRKLVKLKEQLPEEREVSELLKQISELGLKAGLEILLWKPEARRTDPQGLFVEIPVKVEVLTEYHNLGNFFSDISRLPRLVNISDIILKSKDKQGAGSIKGTFTARTFASIKQGDVQAKVNVQQGRKVRKH